jgi:hypothetical protein
MITWCEHPNYSGITIASAGPAKFEIQKGVGADWAVSLYVPGDNYGILRDPDIEVCKRFCEWVARAMNWV